MSKSAPKSNEQKMSPAARRAIFLPVFATLAMIVVVAIFVPQARHLPGSEGQLSDLGQAPVYELVDQTGAPVQAQQLEGNIQVVNFIFTSCQGVCPMLTSKMKAFGERVSDVPGVQFVSFSVDPARDTPEVLAEYGAQYGADPASWRFLTGEREMIDKVVDGYLQVAQEVLLSDGTVDIVHSERFILVDPRGRIRGFYETQGDGLDVLERDLRELAARQSS